MDQMNLFEVMYEKYHISHKIRLIELFGGIGSQAKSLENLQDQGKLPMGFEHYRLVEYDKCPVASYNAVHGTHFEPIDITKIHAEDLGIVERERFDYILTYSFPCQDLSISGKGKGMKKGSGTRSGLLWEVERLINEMGDNLCQVLLMENVPNILGDKNIEDFKSWVDFLESKGYQCYYELLNAKNYGIPQNRQRCFMISILGDYYYEFPKPIDLKIKLNDILQPEEEVDEKYYLSEKMIKYISFNGTKDFKNPDCKINLDIARPITTEQNKRAGTTNYLSKDLPANFDLSQIKNKYVKESLENCDLDSIDESAYIDGFNRTVRKDNCSGTIDTGISFRNKNFIMIKENTKKGYVEAQEGDSINLERPESKTRRGRVGKQIAQTLLTNCEQGVVVKNNDLSPECIGGFGKKYNDDYQYSMQNRIYDDKIATSVTTAFNPFYKFNLNIRKLTPKECWRLMGFDDASFERASKVNSNAQLYKQAGNSIVVNVLMAIFSQLL